MVRVSKDRKTDFPDRFFFFLRKTHFWVFFCQQSKPIFWNCPKIAIFVYAFPTQKRVGRGQKVKKNVFRKIQLISIFFSYRPFSGPKNSIFGIWPKIRGFRFNWKMTKIMKIWPDGLISVNGNAKCSEGVGKWSGCQKIGKLIF